ncbi:WxL domain-containing protein [Liquorilactobacillus sucicola]|uniref:WxL domain-containing protein n=1 Tax=Liquorilactobacillus sucicola TaxID=519050 RepID=UPI0009DF0EAB
MPDNDYNGSLKLNAVPDLNFGKVNLSAIYNGAKIRLHNGNSDKINRIIVADYRGYNRSQRGWSVNAYITPLTNGPFTITPTITLKLKPAALNVTTPTAITLSAKTATPVLTSLKIPTNGIRSATVLTRGSSTLNFNTLTRTQRENFQPGKYHGRIIWTLNNTASDD